MKNSFIFIVLMSVFTSSQAGLFDFWKKKKPTNETVITNVVDGDTRTIVLTGEEYVKTRSIEVSEETRGKCFDANAAMPTSDTAQALREMRLATGGGIPCGAGYGDALVAEQNRKLGQTQARWGGAEGLGKALIGGATTGYLGGKALDAVESIFTTQAQNAGTNISINPSDNSSVDIDGNIGEGNAIKNKYDEVELPEEVESFVCVDLRPVLSSDPIGVDVNGDGLVCSDGSGATLDN